MKKVVYRDKATGKITGIEDYEHFLTCITAEELIKSVAEFNGMSELDSTTEIVELDDVSEFYAALMDKAIALNQQYSSIIEELADISERITDLANYITDFARKIQR